MVLFLRMGCCCRSNPMSSASNRYFSLRPVCNERILSENMGVHRRQIRQIASFHPMEWSQMTRERCMSLIESLAAYISSITAGTNLQMRHYILSTISATDMCTHIGVWIAMHVCFIEVRIKQWSCCRTRVLRNEAGATDLMFNRPWLSSEGCLHSV